MWLTFALACVMGMAMVFVPGFLAALALGLALVEAAAFAPVLSICFYVLAPVVFAVAGIAVNGWILFGAGCALGALLLLVRVPRGKGHAGLFGGQGNLSSLAPWFPLIACGVGLITALIVFVASIGSPDNFIESYDNAYHLSRAYSFLTSGNYSSLYGSFYPSAWHCLVAMIASCTGAGITLAVNAATVAVEAVCYPLSIYALSATLFGANSRRTGLSCICCTAIAFFPWRIILFGPLYPNVLSFALMPAVCAAFILFINALMGKKPWATSLVLFILGGIVLALAQPNSIFSAAVYLVPFCVYSLWHFCRSKGKGIGFAALAAALFIALVVVIWVALFNAPSMQGVVTYYREPRYGLTDALWQGLVAMCFTTLRPQVVAGILALVGLAVLAYKREQTWLIPAYLFTVALYVVAITVGDDLNILTGFWYSDFYRLAAAVCVFAIPFIGCGLDATLGFCSSRLVAFCAKTEWCQAGYSGKHARAGKVLTVLNTYVVAIVALLLFVLNTFPIEITPHIMPWRLRAYGFGAVTYELRDSFWQANWRYLEDSEIDFLEQAKEIAGSDLVLNQPYDGSVFGGPIAGLNIAFDQFNASQYSEAGTTLIRELKDYAANTAVQDAVKKLDAKYVILLDQWNGSLEGLDGQEGTWYDLGYNPADWQGINGITEDTPGFTLVLSQGDMHLYRIDDIN